MNNPESVTDWGYRAMHGSIGIGKQILHHYFGRDIEYSYYAGCSTGGRQGLKEMQISPDSFDGILAGAPAWWTTHLQSWTTWYPLQNLPDSPGYIPAARFLDIARAIDKQCDPQDGLADRITQNPFHCAIDYTALNLTELQITTLKALYGNWTSPDGTFYFANLSPGSLLALADPYNPNPLGYTFYSYFIYNNPSYNFTDFTLDDLALADIINPGFANADVFSAIEPFAQRGGKLMMYHGWQDMAIPTGSSLRYYNMTTQGVSSGSDIDDYFRLFLVPNMGHCSGSQPPGSDAPWYFSAASQNPGPARSGVTSGVPSTDAEGRQYEYDAILALMRWVEEGKAPERIVATKFKGDNSTEVVRRGVICKWPEKAAWKGKDEDDSRTDVDGWVCEA
jgi:feruloyl esterase